MSLLCKRMSWADGLREAREIAASLGQRHRIVETGSRSAVEVFEDGRVLASLWFDDGLVYRQSVEAADVEVGSVEPPLERGVVDTE